MKFIDFHDHIYPDKIARKATQSVIDFYSLTPDDPDITATSSVLLEEGGQAGISEYVILTVANRPDQVHSINEFAVRMKNSYPQFHCMGTLHAAYNRLIEEVDFIHEKGLMGIKLHPDTQQFHLDDPRLFPVYDYCQGRIPFIIHCGDYRYDYSHPRRLRHVLDLFPHLEVIGAHLGGWSIFREGPRYLGDKDCFVDISSCSEFIPSEEVVRYIRMYGAERCLFGTDFPLWDPREAVDRFLKLPLTDHEKELIAHENAEKLLARWDPPEKRGTETVTE